MSSRRRRRRSDEEEEEDADDDVVIEEIKPRSLKRSGADLVEDEDDIEVKGEMQFTQQAPEQSQPLFPVKESEKSNLDKLGSDGKQKAVKDLSRLLLFKGLAGEPIDRRKCLKEALTDLSNERIASAAFHEAGIRLEEVFGFELRRVPKFMEQRKNFPTRYKERLYIINGLEDEEGGSHSKAIHSVHTAAANEKGLLMVILAFAFCKGEARGHGGRWIRDKDLYRLLHGLDENIPAEPPAVGTKKQGKTSRYQHDGDSAVSTPNVDHLLDRFVYLDYLIKEKQDSAALPSQREETAFAYSMGPRAAMEIGRRQVISFCAEILDEQPDPTMLAEIEDGADDGEPMQA